MNINLKEVTKGWSKDRIAREKKALIKSYKYYMDIHLDLLNEAIERNDENSKRFQKTQLKSVSAALKELGYFR